MFIPGTRVMVVSSSITKKKKDIIGPRFGSIGYTSCCLNAVRIREFEAIVCPMDIFFVRYGFEKKPRIERKVVLGVFPAKSVRQHKDLSKFIPEFMDKNKNFQRQACLDINAAADREVITENTTVVLLAKCPSFIDLLSCNDAEFEGWFNSVLCDKGLLFFLSNIISGIKTIRINDALSNVDLTSLWSTMYEKTIRTKLIETIKGDRNSRSLWISRVRVLFSIYQRRVSLQNQLNFISSIPESGKNGIPYDDTQVIPILKTISNVLYFPQNNKLAAVKFLPVKFREWATAVLVNTEKEIDFIEKFAAKVVESRVL